MFAERSDGLAEDVVVFTGAQIHVSVPLARNVQEVGRVVTVLTTHASWNHVLAAKHARVKHLLLLLVLLLLQEEFLLHLGCQKQFLLLKLVGIRKVDLCLWHATLKSSLLLLQIH